MATTVKFTESKLPVDFHIKYFIKSYHGGIHNVESAKKHYFEMIEQNAFDVIINKKSRHEAYKSFIETPILEGGLGSTNDDFINYFHNHDDVLLKHRELWSKGKQGQGGNRYNKLTDNNNIIISKPIQGTSRTYSIQRLEQSGNTELAAKVISKEISANAAMIKVGLKTPTITVKQIPDDFIRVINNIFTSEQIKHICEKLTYKS